MSLIKRGLKNSSYLLVGRIILVFLGLTSSIILTRNLSLSEYGSLAIVFNYVTIFTYFSFNGISSYTMREGARNIDEFSNLIDKTSGIKFFFAIIAQLLCISVIPLTPYSHTVKLFIVIYSFYIPFNSFLNHWLAVFDVHEKFVYRALINIIPSVFYVTSIIIIIFFVQHNQIPLLVIANLVSFFMGLLFCYIFSQKVMMFKSSIFTFLFNKKIIIGGTYFFIITLAGLLFAKIDVFMVSFLGTEEQVGIYNLTNRFARMGTEFRTFLFAGFFPVMIKEVNTGKIFRNEIYKYTIIIFVITCIAALIGNYFSEDLFTFIYGGKYALSGALFGVLCFFFSN
ncbi:MAG: hypothetical protein CMG62_00035 [Candidatus Marinimicrobia bacterium]|nr:hypothetical protein [Candidatus Neomarinimicrobiota bacterium]